MQTAKTDQTGRICHEAAQILQLYGLVRGVEYRVGTMIVYCQVRCSSKKVSSPEPKSL